MMTPDRRKNLHTSLGAYLSERLSYMLASVPDDFTDAYSPIICALFTCPTNGNTIILFGHCEEVVILVQALGIDPDSVKVETTPCSAARKAQEN